MKKVLCVGLLCVVGFAFSGCPLIGANIDKEIIGGWEWKQAAAVLSQSIIDNIGEDGGYANETVAQNFKDYERGRARKAITFSDDGKVTYLEEVWGPDRQPEVGYEEWQEGYYDENDNWVDGEYVYHGDGGAAVVWDWRLSLKVSGTYQLGPYDGDSSLLFSIPGLDTELFIDVETYTTSIRELGDSDDADKYNRRMYEYTEEEISSSDSNPLGMYALVGINSFDQLLLGWDVGGWKQFNYNVMGLEVYRRM